MFAVCCVLFAVCRSSLLTVCCSSCGDCWLLCGVCNLLFAAGVWQMLSAVVCTVVFDVRCLLLVVCCYC